MQLVYTTGWTRDKIRTEESYSDWLNSLKNGDHVLKQNFQPANHGIFDYPVERWEFERVKIWNDSLITRGNTSPFDSQSGKCKYWGGKDDWGNVFPARIIPLTSDLPTKELGDEIYGHFPVYEPLFLNAHRLVFFVQHGREFTRSRTLVRKTFPYSYSLEVNEGDLYHCFTQGELDETNRKTKQLTDTGIKFLYSQYCKP